MSGSGSSTGFEPSPIGVHRLVVGPGQTLRLKEGRFPSARVGSRRGGGALSPLRRKVTLTFAARPIVLSKPLRHFVDLDEGLTGGSPDAGDLR